MIKKVYIIYRLFIIIFILLLYSYSNVYSMGNEELIDLRLKNADLVDVVKMLAEKGKYNIVAGPEVKGRVTLDLHGVTVQDSLDAALRINGFGYEKQGGLIFIRPLSQEETKEPSSQLSTAHPLIISSYKVNYSDASEVVTILKESISKYGKINFNRSNNIIVVEDTEEKLKKIENILKELDVTPKQVLIEAKILEIRLSNDLQLGVDWSQIFKSGDASFTLQGANFSHLPSAGTPGLFFNSVSPRFNLFLDALQQKGNLKTLATPKLVALDNKEAQIIIGGRLGYRVTTTSNQITTESVEFLNIGTMLKITPRIGNDGNILLKIYPKISDGVITQGLPSETTTEVTTSVIVKDGESLFIGGLIRDRKEKTDSQIPFIGNIPIIGSLFKRNTDSITRTETIIVLTPHIVDSQNKETFQREKEKTDSFSLDK